VKAVQSILLVSLTLGLVACDKLPIPDPNRAALQKEQDAKAIGGACRHAGRALEDCYKLNRKASKGAVFAGWREMNDYMTQNKLDVVQPTIVPVNATHAAGDTPPPAAPASEKPSGHNDTHAKPADEKNPALTAG
jgi:hypothetical protein